MENRVIKSQRMPALRGVSRAKLYNKLIPSRIKGFNMASGQDRFVKMSLHFPNHCYSSALYQCNVLCSFVLFHAYRILVATQSVCFLGRVTPSISGDLPETWAERSTRCHAQQAAKYIMYIKENQSWIHGLSNIGPVIHWQSDFMS